MRVPHAGPRSSDRGTCLAAIDAYANHEKRRTMQYTSSLTTFFCAAAVALVFTASAQTRSPGGLQQSESTVAAESPNAAGAPQNTDSEDVEFLTEALHTAIAEAQMGQLAQQRGSAPVKEFGKKLEADHTRAVQEIKGILG